jgi:hypothetical protein
MGFFPSLLQSPQAYRTAWALPGALTGTLNYYCALRLLGYGLLTATYQVGVLGLVILGRAKQVLVDLEPERTGTIRTGVDH